MGDLISQMMSKSPDDRPRFDKDTYVYSTKVFFQLSFMFGVHLYVFLYNSCTSCWTFSAGAILNIPFVKEHLSLFIEGKKNLKEQQRYD